MHTGDLESLNALLLKYAKKTHAFRLVIKIQEPNPHQRVTDPHGDTLSASTPSPSQGHEQTNKILKIFLQLVGHVDA